MIPWASPAGATLTIERRINGPLDIRNSVVYLSPVHVEFELDVVKRHPDHVALLYSGDLARGPVVDVDFVQFLLVVSNDVVATQAPREFVHTPFCQAQVGLSRRQAYRPGAPLLHLHLEVRFGLDQGGVAQSRPRSAHTLAPFHYHDFITCKREMHSGGATSPHLPMNAVSSWMGFSRGMWGTAELNLKPSRQPLRQQNTDTVDIFTS
jgi:hypothetical protein